MVPGFAEVRDLCPLRVWTRDRTHGSVDLRHSPHPRSHRLSSPDPSFISLAAFYLVPQSVQHLQPGGRHIDPAVLGPTLDRLESLAEFPIGSLQSAARLYPDLSSQIHHRKQHIADLLHQLVTGRR